MNMIKAKKKDITSDFTIDTVKMKKLENAIKVKKLKNVIKTKKLKNVIKMKKLKNVIKVKKLMYLLKVKKTILIDLIFFRLCQQEEKLQNKIKQRYF